ncbi:hypothetical protein [Rubrivirga marina]|uniref:Lipoprotein n=1 Tax=Rubrivirga marina TaxID=1196024 RepID=A0A271ISJ7_9BACT|nr:hypothetical protein [Rubrivirga marina]PAP74212.1 hypothetical protein BSZ37_21360 [Rubrivirga marina]
MKHLALLSVAALALVGCDSNRPTSFDVEIDVLPWPDEPATEADVTFVAPDAAGPGLDTLRFGVVQLPWRYEAEGLGIGQYTLEACVPGSGIAEARLDVSNGYQGFVTHGFGQEYGPGEESGTCAYGSFRVSDRTETPPWEQ